MSRQTTIILTDDVDGGPATETVLFGLDGTSYEIDLSADHAAALRSLLAPAAAAGRRVGALGSTTTFTRVVTDYDPAALRAWAAAHQIALPARGRAPAEVVARYRAAGN